MKTILASLAVTILPFAIAAAEPDAGERRGPPRKPPQEAFTACANLSEGDTCNVKLRDRTISGTCETFPDQTALACRPDHPPGPPPSEGSDH
jgi:hypothetical protein